MAGTLKNLNFGQSSAYITGVAFGNFFSHLKVLSGIRPPSLIRLSSLSLPSPCPAFFPSLYVGCASDGYFQLWTDINGTSAERKSKRKGHDQTRFAFFCVTYLMKLALDSAICTVRTHFQVRAMQVWLQPSRYAQIVVEEVAAKVCLIRGDYVMLWLHGNITKYNTNAYLLSLVFYGEEWFDC